jgi:hypothetical protein
MCSEKNQSDVFQEDVRDLLEALGLGTHARPKSPHEVIQDEIIPAIESLKKGNQTDGSS